MHRCAGVSAVSSVVPGREVSSDELASLVSVPAGWIESRTDIRSRRFTDESATTLGVSAARELISQFGVDPTGVGVVVYTSSLPDRLTPPTAPTIAAAIGAAGAGAFDMNAACAGGAYGLELARALVVAGHTNSVLVVASEHLSPFLDYEDRDTAVLFGDGAGAALVESVEMPSLYPAVSYSDGDNAELVTQTYSFEQIATGLNRPAASTMDGTAVYRWVRKHVPSLCQQALDKAGWSSDDVEVFIPHQANGTIITKVAEQLDLLKVPTIRTVEALGNTSSASMFQAMNAAIDSGFGGRRSLLVGFGAG